MFTLTPIAILAGLGVVSGWAAARIGIQSAKIAGGLATVALAVAWTPATIPTANSARFEQYRRIATWLETNAAATPRPLVLAEEIGIIGYYAPSFPFVDPPGILVPNLTREQVADWRGLVCRREPGVLIFAEDLGQEVIVRDRVHLLDHRYDRVATLPARDFLRHIYRRRL